MNPLPEIIRAEIVKSGAISFHRFMELALYCPDYGFYEMEKKTIGRRGDFYTSVSVGPLFGQMLAYQFAEWLTESKVQTPNSKLQIVEAGAHDGKLALDILKWLRDRRPEIFNELQYVIIEGSERRRTWQAETLAEFAGNVLWVNAMSELNVPKSAAGNSPSFTIIFSNELLDALPVHRIGWDARNKTWFEWGVAFDGEQFVWIRLPADVANHVSVSAFQVPRELLEVLPHGFTTEISPGAEALWRAAAQNLGRGKLMTIDYGLVGEDFFRPERRDGTLRSYQQHHVGNCLLANPGEQDITAHVNFSSLQAVGEAAGLRTDAFVPQGKFLTSIAENIWQRPENFDQWMPLHTRHFQTLTHPEHLGRSFKVLLQSRSI